MNNRHLRFLLPATAVLVLLLATYLLFFWEDRAQTPAAISPQETALREDAPTEPLRPQPDLSLLPGGEERPPCPQRTGFADPASWLEAVENWFRLQVTPLCTGKGMKALLEGPDLLRRAVALVNNVARGESFVAHLPPAWLPQAPYQSKTMGEGIVPDPANATRHRALLAEFESLDAAALVALLPALHPTLQYLHEELGQSREPFLNVLVQALNRAQALSLPPPPLFLEQGVATFRYLEAGLEEMAPGDKAFLRLGHAWNTLKRALSAWQVQIQLHLHPQPSSGGRPPHSAGGR